MVEIRDSEKKNKQGDVICIRQEQLFVILINYINLYFLKFLPQTWLSLIIRNEIKTPPKKHVLESECLLCSWPQVLYFDYNTPASANDRDLPEDPITLVHTLFLWPYCLECPFRFSVFSGHPLSLKVQVIQRDFVRTKLISFFQLYVRGSIKPSFQLCFHGSIFSVKRG